MTVSKYTRPNYTAQSGTVYPSNIDAMAAAFERIAAAFAPHEQDAGSPAPDLTIVVDAGAVLDLSGAAPDLNEAAQQTVSGFTIPATGQTRVDRVVINETTGAAIRVAGTPQTTGGSPTAEVPAIPAATWPVCRVTITSADTAITNDMIVDERCGVPVKQAASTTTAAATQAQMEAASSTTVYASPGRQQFHPGHPKAWGYVTFSGGVPTLAANYGISSVTDTATGRTTMTLTTAFSSANYSNWVTVENTNVNGRACMVETGKTTTAFVVNTYNLAGSDADLDFSCGALGDQ